MLALPQVSLVMLATAEHQLARLSVEDCCKHAEFGDVIIVSDRPEKVIPYGVTCRHIHVPEWTSADGAQLFLWYELPPLLRTTHWLWIQWDSWVLHPDQWDSSFLAFDYVGAPWWYETNNVGNGGFSLRSTRLSRHLMDNAKRYPIMHPEDDVLCRGYRQDLETKGFKWADVPLAAKFSFECIMPTAKTFGFHCLRNWPLVLDQQAFYERISLASSRVARHGDHKIATDLAEKLGIYGCGQLG